MGFRQITGDGPNASSAAYSRPALPRVAYVARNLAASVRDRSALLGINRERVFVHSSARARLQ